MDLIVTDVKLKYGLMLWEDRHYIVNQVKKNGSAKLYVDCDSRCECGGKEKFPFKISTQSLVKNNRTIQLISRYESGPKAIFRITKIYLSRYIAIKNFNDFYLFTVFINTFPYA